MPSAEQDAVRVTAVSVDRGDPLGLRGDAPLLDAYLAFLERPGRPFTIPGHKQRADVFGDVVRGDVPLFAGLDTMKLRRGILAEAEARAADLWEADFCRFSVGGSTHGNQALALAVSEPGARVVVPRTLHRSLLLGLVLAGLEPIWIRPEIEERTGLPLAVSAEAVADAVARNPEVKAVFVGDPTYVGTFGDIAAIADVAHSHGVPLVVDAAWAAHFGFHPDLPPHALRAGADAVVLSAHKMLPAYSQAAIMLARTDRIDPARLDRAFEATQTTSPAGAILASIDMVRALLARDGPLLLERLLLAVGRLRAELLQVPGVTILKGAHVDAAKLVVLLAGTGADGNLVERELIRRRMPLEMADRDTLVAIVTVADDTAAIEALKAALIEAIELHRRTPRPSARQVTWTVAPEPVLAPREAFFRPHVRCPLARSVGRVCAELVAAYPPGVPILAPGERITREAIDAILSARDAGTRIAYAADPTLNEVLVVA